MITLISIRGELAFNTLISIRGEYHMNTIAKEVGIDRERNHYIICLCHTVFINFKVIHHKLKNVSIPETATRDVL